MTGPELYKIYQELQQDETAPPWYDLTTQQKYVWAEMAAGVSTRFLKGEL